MKKTGRMSSEDTLAFRLRLLRSEHEMTQDELGVLAGSNQATIQKIENGKSIHPRILIQLAETLDVNPAWLQYGERWAARSRSWKRGRKR